MKNALSSIFVIAVILLGTLIGCSKENEEKQVSEELKHLEVEIVADEKIELNKEVEIACLVTYGDEKVTDADEVKFEIWKQGEEKHEMITGEHQGDGKYAVTKTFTEAEKYSVVAHVTARSMHNMPKKEIMVGQVQENQAVHETTNKQTHHSHPHANVIAELQQTQPFVAGENTELTASVTFDHEPLTEANVKFEIWKDNEKKHEFIEATELGKGQYKANYQFSQPGLYHVNIHVEKGEIHEHQLEKIDVR